MHFAEEFIFTRQHHTYCGAQCTGDETRWTSCVYFYGTTAPSW